MIKNKKQKKIFFKEVRKSKILSFEFSFFQFSQEDKKNNSLLILKLVSSFTFFPLYSFNQKLIIYK